MNKHKHLFKNVGGGCLIAPQEEFPCDDVFECNCGEGFKLKTSKVGHFYLPEQFESQPLSEAKEAEKQAIIDASIENLSAEN